MNLALFAGIAIIVVLFLCVFAVGVYMVGFRQTFLSFVAMIVILVLVRVASGLIEYGLMQP